MVKRRIWIRRKDRVRQRYWVGRSKKNYGAFKFISPWKQLQETGEVEPDFARFGTRKLRVGEEREILKLEKELSDLRRSKVEREKLVKELEKPPKVKFEDEKPRKEINPEGKFIINLKKKVEETTP